MNARIKETLSASARDARTIVWPRIATTPLINGGNLCPVECLSDEKMPVPLDTLAGIDAWQVQHGPACVRGIASRVQWDCRFRSFTIRTRSVHGQETELQKRRRAIDHSDDGHLYPHLTVQGFVNKRERTLIAAAAIKTRSLIDAAQQLLAPDGTIRQPSDAYGLRNNADGSAFLYITWSYLIDIGALAAADLVEA